MKELLKDIWIRISLCTLYFGLMYNQEIKLAIGGDNTFNWIIGFLVAVLLEPIVQFLTKEI